MSAANQINHTFDLLSLAEQDTALRKTGVNWWAGPCPFCGGTDRFILKQTVTGWRWFCRHCGGDRYHTALDYIMQRQACTFPEAINWIESSRLFFPPPASVIASAAKQSPLPASVIASAAKQSPYAVWQSRALAYLQTCETALWSDSGEQAQTWLRARGLKEHTLRRYRIGFNPKDLFEPLSEWGFPQPDDGKRHAVWLPRGIVIPCYENDQLYYLKTRRPLTHAQLHRGQQKYVKVKGSRPGLFGAWNLRGAWLAVLTEGELDCMLLDQEAGDLAAVATLGSASDRISQLYLSIWDQWLVYVAHFLIAYDLDLPGEKGLRALEGFTERTHRAVLPDLPGVKDITDFYLAGGDLADWLCRTVERLDLLDL